MKKNLKQNGYKNVICINKAISNKDEKTTLYINERNTGDHRLYDSYDNRKKVTVESITLDTYFKNKQIKVNLIKMDIQGSEFKALMGSKNLLKNNKSLILFTELSPIGLKINRSSADEYFTFLDKNRFKIFEILEKEKQVKPITKEKLLKKYTPELMNNANLLCIR